MCTSGSIHAGSGEETGGGVGAVDGGVGAVDGDLKRGLDELELVTGAVEVVTDCAAGPIELTKYGMRIYLVQSTRARATRTGGSAQCVR